MRKCISFLLVLCIILGAGCGIPVAAASETAQTRTVMLYLDGSDLESNFANATWNLVQCMDAEYDENLNFIVITGGSKKWHTGSEYLSGAEEIDPEYNQIWKLEGKREGEEHGKMILLESTGIKDYENTLMSKPETLTAFADYCYSNFPADQYDIILWNHGAGPALGFGNDDRIEDYNLMALHQIVQAFADTKLIKDEKKFEMINFDACVMSSVEIVTSLENYTDYMVMSPESEPGKGQEYTTWLNAVKRDPSMNGFELGKYIVDAMIAFYSNDEGTDDAAALSVIDAENFRERQLPQLAELDELLISEAKNVGSRNNRYNFYDELYSAANSYSYNLASCSLYDLGNLAGALSVPQSEVDNVTQKQVNNSENIYTDVALDILSILRDQDGSGDDVIYTRGTRTMKKTVAAGYLRNKDGEVVWADDNNITVPTTGLSLFFGDSSAENAHFFINSLTLDTDMAQSDDEKNYLDRRSVAAAYYCLIFQMGSNVSMLSDKGEKYINYRKVKKLVQENETAWYCCQTMINRLVSAGEFDSFDEAEDYLSLIVAQQSKEVVSKNKVKVKQIVNNDGSFTDYQVTVSNTSAQAFMSVNSAAMVTCRNTDTKEFNFIMGRIYGSDYSFDQLYPNGIGATVSVSEGTFDSADYYNSIDDTSAQINQRIYASTSSVWSVPCTKETCFVLYDDDKAPHLADIHYLDKSYTTAYIPIIIYWAEGVKSSEGYRAAYLYISKTDGEWSINGVTLNTNEGAERSYMPMDSEQFAGCRFAPAESVADVVYNFNTFMPISTFDDVDITKDKWGVTFGEMPIGELDDVKSYEAKFYVEDVYGYKIDITDRFAKADEVAQNGDVVHDINLAEAVVEPAVYNGIEQKPDVSLTMNGKKLVETEDYKVIYLGYVQPGTAYLAVLGLGDYIGTAYIPFTIYKRKLLGDVNGDGEVNITDVSFIQKYIAEIPTSVFIDEAADTNEDGDIDINDATAIQRWLAGMKANDKIGKPIA